MRPSVVHRGARWGAGLLLLLASCSTSPPAHPGRPLDVTIKDFKVLLSVDATRPGTVTFEVSNQGPTTHEFVVAQLDDSEGGGDRSSGYGYGSATLRGSAYGGVTSSSSGGYGYGSDADAGGHAAAGGPSDGKLLPIGGDGLSVDEDSVDVVDELEEVLDGDRDSLTVSLEPGKYVLFCNLEGHYLAGMYATIEVA